MRLSYSFKIESEELNKLIGFAKENLTKESWAKCFEESNGEFQQFGQSTNNIILLVLTAIGLLKIGFNEEETFRILENLLEVDPKRLSPGNLNIH